MNVVYMYTMHRTFHKEQLSAQSPKLTKILPSLRKRTHHYSKSEINRKPHPHTQRSDYIGAIFAKYTPLENNTFYDMHTSQLTQDMNYVCTYTLNINMM